MRSSTKTVFLFVTVLLAPLGGCSAMQGLESVTSGVSNPVDRRFIGSEMVDGSFMEGRIYGIVALGRETAPSELSHLNKYLADLAGVTL